MYKLFKNREFSKFLLLFANAPSSNYDEDQKRTEICRIYEMYYYLM